MKHEIKQVSEGTQPGISDPLSNAVNMRDRDILLMVRDALKEKRAMLAFQPVVQTRAPEKPAFYEGLIRIQDRTGRIIPAREFIDTVEDTQLGRVVDCLALELGLKTLMQFPELRISINMSALSVGYERWTSILDRALKADTTVGERLILEITERSAIVMPDAIKQFMDHYQSQGIAFAMDDFGAGYTALRYMRDFYFDILKIDGQFINDIHKSPDNQALVKAFQSIAQHFDMYTVAENVENAKDAQILADLGIDCMQGYFFGVPTIKPYWTRQADISRTG